MKAFFACSRVAILVVTALLTSSVSSREWKSGGYNKGYYYDNGCDFFAGEGYDFDWLSKSATECAKACVQNPKCTHFHHSHETHCYHKRNTGYAPEISKYQSATCGWIPGRSMIDQYHQDTRWFVWHNGDGGVKWRENCDFPDHDLKKVEVEPVMCGRSCINHIGCNAFSWEDGLCTLKNIPETFEETTKTTGGCGFLPWQFPNVRT